MTEPTTTRAHRGRLLGSLFVAVCLLGATGTAAAAETGSLRVDGPTFLPPITVGQQHDVVLRATNIGTANVSITGIAEDDPSGSFEVEAPGCLGRGGELRPGAFCEVVMHFRPVAAGSVQLKLAFTHTGGNTPTEFILNGVGMAVPPSLAAMIPTGASFSYVDVGQTTVARSVRLENIGFSPIVLTGVIEDDPASGFVVDDECTGVELDPDETCTATTVRFAPTAEGLQSAMLTFTHSGAGAPPTIETVGYGTPGAIGQLVLSFIEGSGDFGDVEVGTASTRRRFRLFNSGSAPLTVTSVTTIGVDAPAFVLIDGCTGLVLAPGESCDGLSVAFAPHRSGLHSMQVSVANTGATSPVEFEVLGNGIVVNHPPTASDLSFAAVEDAPLVIGAPGVLAGAGDSDGDALVASGISAPTHGSVVLEADGSFTYVPIHDFVGSDGFGYSVDDGRGGTATATVTIEVAEAPRWTPTLATTPIGLRLTMAGIRLTLAPTAMLSEPDGTPLGGRTITFHRPNGTLLCIATTGASGTAACPVTLTTLLNVLLAGGFEARFPGDHDRTPITARGAVVLVS